MTLSSRSYSTRALLIDGLAGSSCSCPLVSSVLLNGIPGNHFHCKRGVRQEDPLSPLLFVLVADLLQSVVNRMCADGQLTLPIPNNNPDYPIVQYADDPMLVTPACETQLMALKDMLGTFAASTGVHVNYNKSQLIPLN